MELGFTVPLLKVPLQGAKTGMPLGMGGQLFKEPIDVNIGALFVAGSMLVTVMGIVPAIYQAFAKPKAPPVQFARCEYAIITLSLQLQQNKYHGKWIAFISM